MARRLIPIAFLLGCAGAAFAAEPVRQGVVQAGPPLAEAPGAAPLRPARSLSPDEQSGAVLPAVAAMALRGADAGPVSAMPGLRGALDDALARDPYSRAAFADVKAADREVWRELLRYAPTVYGTVNVSRTDTAAPARIETGRESYATLEAAWKVLDGGTTYYAVKAARARRDAAVHDAMTERGRTTLKVIDAWTGAIANGRELAVAEAAVSRLRKLRAAVSARRDAGFAAASDVAQVDADIAAARRTVASLQAAADKSRAASGRLAGRVPDRDAALPDFSAALGVGRQALIDGAHRENPQLRAASSRYYSEIYASRSAFGRHLPSVELTAQYRIGYDQAVETAANADRLTVGARLRVPIVDLATVADTAVQSARVEAALYREAATLQDVETQIDNLWADWRAAGAMRKEAETEAAMRRKSAGAARQRFENGFGSLEEAIRAEAALATAERAALQMQAQESLTAAQLLVISGRFRPELLD